MKRYFYYSYCLFCGFEQEEITEYLAENIQSYIDSNNEGFQLSAIVIEEVQP